MADTVVFLTTTGGNQTWTVPADWSDANTVECIGGGGNGGNGISSTSSGGGGGGGAYSKSVNLTGITPGGSVTYRVGDVGADTWFNDTSFPASGQACGAKGGTNGASITAGTGGLSSGCYATGTGSALFSGGNGGAGFTSTICVPGGGGGAAGLHGAGGNGADSTGFSGGAGGTGDAGNTAAAANGQQYDSTHGSGGGGQYSGGTTVAGGTYGGAGCGGLSFTLLTGTAGKQGLIVITYTPAFVIHDEAVSVSLSTVPAFVKSVAHSVALSLSSVPTIDAVRSATMVAQAVSVAITTVASAVATAAVVQIVSTSISTVVAAISTITNYLRSVAATLTTAPSVPSSAVGMSVDLAMAMSVDVSATRHRIGVSDQPPEGGVTSISSGSGRTIVHD